LSDKVISKETFSKNLKPTGKAEKLWGPFEEG
jgi:hypothetical protein